MANFNRVILMGNMTRDPQLSYTPSNTAVCEFGLAMNRRFNDRDGNSRDETTFVDLKAFGRTGEVIKQYMTKGRPLMVEGRLSYSQWTNKEGQKRNKLEVIVENFTFVGGPGGGGDQGGQGGGGYQSGGQQGQGGGYQGGGQQGGYDAPPPPPAGDSGPPSDTEIPF